MSLERATRTSSAPAGSRSVAVVKRSGTTIRAGAFFVLAAAAIGRAYQSGAPWPPPLQTVAKESPVLAPAAAMKTIFTAPGYRLELVASEPLIQDPILIDFDPA